jgi:hypothetical protein
MAEKLIDGVAMRALPCFVHKGKATVVVALEDEIRRVLDKAPIALFAKAESENLTIQLFMTLLDFGDRSLKARDLGEKGPLCLVRAIGDPCLKRVMRGAWVTPRARRRLRFLVLFQNASAL